MKNNHVIKVSDRDIIKGGIIPLSTNAQLDRTLLENLDEPLSISDLPEDHVLLCQYRSSSKGERVVIIADDKASDALTKKHYESEWATYRNPKYYQCVTRGI